MSAVNSSTYTTLKNWEALPDSAFIPLPVVCALFGCSPATVWRRVRSGDLVAPKKIGAGTTRWQVADIRRELINAKEENK
jgi:predicted DNA-binding transcriptional regulator AlpA